MTFASVFDWMNYSKCNICKNLNNIFGVITFRYETNHFKNIIDYAYSKRKMEKSDAVKLANKLS